jgi:hypothetical protein
LNSKVLLQNTRLALTPQRKSKPRSSATHSFTTLPIRVASGPNATLVAQTLKKKAFLHHLNRKSACESVLLCYFSRRLALRGRHRAY